MSAVIFANGLISHPELIKHYDLKGDFIICVDGGTDTCLKLGYKPDLVVGDLDSISDESLEIINDNAIPIEQHPTQKDQTDLEIALDTALDRGFDDVVVLGAIGGRLDQTTANILLPAQEKYTGMKITVIDPPEEIYYLHESERLSIKAKNSSLVSLIPLTEKVNGITTQGLEYPLSNEELIRGSSRGISNTVNGLDPEVSINEGILLCIIRRSNFNSKRMALSQVMKDLEVKDEK